MGLQMTLAKDKNSLHHDFIDAYWCIENISYTTAICDFDLRAYPSRDAKLAYGTMHGNPSVGFGGSDPFVNSVLYRWNGQFSTRDLFPNGIPLDEDTQKTVLYNFVKRYTGLPFVDVFEA